MRPTVRLVFLCAILLYSWGCAQKSAKLQKSVVPPDRTLFETGSEYLKKSQYIKARLAFQTLISTYSDSEMAPDAYMAIGDSFYDEGGTQNLLQAEEQYKNFIVFFPTNPKAADAQLKIIALNYKLRHSPDRDPKPLYKTQDAIQSYLAQFPDSDYVPIVERYLLDVQEDLALGNLGVAQFYEEKENYAGASGRYREIMDKYAGFSRMDDVLFHLATVLEKSQNPEEAAIHYARIASAYPFSKHVEEAKARLNSLGKPIPDVDTQLAAANQARIKPSEGFSPLKPFIEFGKALGFVPPPDLYEQAKTAIAEEKARTAAAAKTGEGGPAGSDIQIESIIRKSATGETRDTTILGSGSDTTQPGGQANEEDKKETNKDDKETNAR